MIESVGEEVPADDFAKAVFHLVKEVGLSHEEIFGGTTYVNFVEERSRDGLFGDALDYVFGPRKFEKTELVDERGMNLKAFATYMELLEEHQEEIENKHKKEKMKNSLKNKTFG